MRVTTPQTRTLFLHWRMLILTNGWGFDRGASGPDVDSRRAACEKRARSLHRNCAQTTAGPAGFGVHIVQSVSSTSTSQHRIDIIPSALKCSRLTLNGPGWEMLLTARHASVCLYMCICVFSVCCKLCSVGQECFHWYYSNIMNIFKVLIYLYGYVI